VSDIGQKPRGVEPRLEYIGAKVVWACLDVRGFGLVGPAPSRSRAFPPPPDPKPRTDRVRCVGSLLLLLFIRAAAAAAVSSSHKGIANQAAASSK